MISEIDSIMIEKVGQSFAGAGHALKRACGLGTPVPKEVLSRALFGQGHFIPKNSPLFSGIGMGSVSMASDYASITRDLQDLGMVLGMDSVFTSQDMLVAYQTFGTVTGINMIIGIVRVVHGFAAKRAAESIGDRQGALLGRVAIAGGGALATGGACFAAFRGLAIYNVVNGVKASSLLGRITHGLASAGMVCASIFFALLTVACGINLHAGLKLKNKIEGAMDFTAKAVLLEKKFGAKPGRVLEKLIEKTGSKELAEKVLREEAISSGKSHLKALMKELGMAQISDEECDEIVRGSVGAQVGFFGTLDGKLQELGLELQTQKTQMRKDEKMERLLSSTGIEAVKSLKGSKATQKLIDVITASNKGKIKEYAANIAILVLGMVTLSAAIVLSGGVGFILASVLMLGFGLLMTAADGYYLLQSYKDGVPAKHDKKLLALSSVMAFTSLASMLALGFAGIVSFGVVPIVITAILTALWLGQNGVSLWVMNRNEHRALVKNPTFEALLKALEGGKGDLAELMLQNLSEDERKLLANEMKAHNGKMLKAVGSVIEKVDGVRKAHLDVLRQGIAKVAIA